MATAEWRVAPTRETRQLRQLTINDFKLLADLIAHLPEDQWIRQFTLQGRVVFSSEIYNQCLSQILHILIATGRPVTIIFDLDSKEISVSRKKSHQ